MKKIITQTTKTICSMSPEEIRLDHQIKKVLACKPILSRILQGVVQECRNMTPEEVEACIEGEVMIDRVPLDPGLTNSYEIIRGDSEEDFIPGEGIVFYDIKTYLQLPDGSQYIKIIIDVEAQKNDNPGYSIPLRALFYCARQISSQLGVEFSNSMADPRKYDGLKKVYSIWICTETAQKRANTIERYKIDKQMLYGENASHSRFDLMEAVIVNIGKKKKPCNNKMLRMLGDLFDESMESSRKIRVLEKEYEIPLTKKSRQEVADMCKYTEQIKVRALEQGIERGRSEERTESIKNMLNDGKTPEEIADFCHYPLEEILEIQKSAK